jgi:predicted transglutaminase-like cysteine proteinase
MTSELAPIAWTMFAIKPKPSRQDTIALVNSAVNTIPAQYGAPPALDEYRIWPDMAWCHDYAVTKREELLLRGFAPKDCLLCECEAHGERHMVLIVDGLVLDNLTPKILPQASVPYRWLRWQSADNPDLWRTT